MPLLQTHTRCSSLLPNLGNRFNVVPSRYTPIIAIYKYETRPCVRARTMRRTKSRFVTYCYLPKERRVWGSLAVLLQVTQYTFAVTPISFPVIFPPFYFWPFLTLSSSTSTCFPSGFTWSSYLYSLSGQDLGFPSSSAPALVFQPPIPILQGHRCRRGLHGRPCSNAASKGMYMLCSWWTCSMFCFHERL